MMKKLIRREKCQGIALVEMALVLPLLLLVSLGAIRYGHLFLRAQEITNALRNGVRLGVRPASDDSAVATEVEYWMNAAGMPQSSSHYTLTFTTGRDIGTMVQGDPVFVQISVPVANVGALQVPLFTNFEPNNGNWNIIISVTMAKEGF